MNIRPALNTTATDLANALTPAPRAYDPHLGDAWRYSLATVEECLPFIAQHSRTIAERNARLPGGFRVHRRAYVIHARKMLALRLRMYREAVRRVSEAQVQMDGIGMRYALSSDDWRY